MSYINGKLNEIERRAENLLNHEATTPLGLEQEYRWISQAIGSIRNQTDMFHKHNTILFKIKEIVDKSGEPVDVLQDIKEKLKSLEV